MKVTEKGPLHRAQVAIRRSSTSVSLTGMVGQSAVDSCARGCTSISRIQLLILRCSQAFSRLVAGRKKSRQRGMKERLQHLSSARKRWSQSRPPRKPTRGRKENLETEDRRVRGN